MEIKSEIENKLKDNILKVETYLRKYSKLFQKIIIKKGK